MIYCQKNNLLWHYTIGLFIDDKIDLYFESLSDKLIKNMVFKSVFVRLQNAPIAIKA